LALKALFGIKTNAFFSCDTHQVSHEKKKVSVLENKMPVSMGILFLQTLARNGCHITLDKCLSTYIAFVGGGNHVFETYLSGEGI
jgi:hypothetical protein